MEKVNMADNKEDNLFFSLFHWAHRQEENFSTEGFAYLLRLLLDKEPEKGKELVRLVTEGKLDLTPERARCIAITCQKDTELGRPDLEIKTQDAVVYIEVKDSAGLGWEQLERYRIELLSKREPIKILVLLTRYVPEFNGDEKADVRLRWYKVAETLQQFVDSGPWKSPESLFVTNQFVGYLRFRGMTMDRVSWELKNGTQAVWNLIKMLGEALSGKKNVKFKKTVGWEFVGYWIEGQKAWVGIYWESPSLLQFEIMEDEEKVNKDTPDTVSKGKVEDLVSATDGLRWVNKLDLESEEEHFFARSFGSQMGRLEEFLKTGLEALGQLENRK